MDVPAALANPELARRLDAAAADSEAIHHDLCAAALIDGQTGGPCSCDIPGLLRELSQLLNGPRS